MNVYNWRAKDPQGLYQAGTIEAVDEHQAIRILQNKKLIVVNLTIKASGFNLSNIQKRIQRVTFGDIVIFTRQLSTMISAGLPLTDSLIVLRDQAPGPVMKEMINSIVSDVEGGSSLALALSRHPRAFSRIYISLVKAGEAAGALDRVLSRLSDNMEKEREFRSKIRGAMIYPSIIIIAMVVVGFIMMIFVVPRFTSIYEELGSELPLPTQILIGASKFMVGFWWLVILAVIGLVMLFLKWKASEIGRKRWDRFVFKIPIIGNLSKQVILTELTRTLALLVSAGIPILEALNIVREAVNNSIYQQGIAIATKQVERGFSLAMPISQNKDFPPILSQMIKTGEQTGKLDEVLMRISVFFESESEHAIKGLTTAIEPLIMVVLGVGVAFMILSVIMPIYQLTSSF